MKLLLYWLDAMYLRHAQQALALSRLSSVQLPEETISPSRKKESWWTEGKWCVLGRYRVLHDTGKFSPPAQKPSVHYPERTDAAVVKMVQSGPQAGHMRSLK